MRAMVKQLQTLGPRRPLVGMEMGVYCGDHAQEILEALPIKRLYLVDHWSAPAQRPDLPKSGAEAYEIAKQQLAPYREKVVFLKQQFADIRNTEPLDFCYIDGDHTRDAVLADITKAMTLVKPGGLVGGHDARFDGVQAALKEYFGPNLIGVQIRSNGTEKDADWWSMIPVHQFTESGRRPSTP